MYNLVREIYVEESVVTSENNWEGYNYVGLRFENKKRDIGEVCEYSRNNVSREDERDFPEYGTSEYFEMEQLDGTSAWDMSENAIYKIESWRNKENDCREHFFQKHCYVIAGNNLGHTLNTAIDDNEIVIKDAVVIAQIF
jgi:hypothetical protein